MLQTDIIRRILKDSSYHLDLFSEAEIEVLRERIFTQTVRGKQIAFVTCAVRNRGIQLKPEEFIRQLYVSRLVTQYGYTPDRLALEYPVSFGRETKRADIVIVDKDRPDTPYIIIEVKKPKLLEGKTQLRSYCNATGAPIGVWTNGQYISHYYRREPNYFEEITEIPNVHQMLSDILSERFTLKNLILKDKLSIERKSLKDIVLELEDEVLSNAGVDVFEEVFKLIFAKLYDEFKSQEDKTFIDRLLRQNMRTATQGQSSPNALDVSEAEAVKAAIEEVPDDAFRVMEFRNTGQTDAALKAKIQRLFDDAKNHWKGVFPEGSTFELSDSHLAVCVASLQDIKMFNSNLQVVDEAFEYLVSKSAKGEKGQYFTPRHVIDMCVKMLNPQPGESMIDTAAGSCGFPVHTIFKLTGNLFTAGDIAAAAKRHIREVFGIDFDEKTVRVARTLNLIAGDGEANVLHLNTLDYERWDDWTERDKQWIITYSGGFKRLEGFRAEFGENQRFHFDMLMANPPFAGDIKERRILQRYRLGFKPNGRMQTKVGRDVLFIERNLDFLKPGGRMAIVLPQGKFSAPKHQHIREFIMEQARILAVVSLHENTFKPHTSPKTSVLFVQKWNDDPGQGPLCPKADNYPIFFAVSEKGGKDTSGSYIYLKNGNGDCKLDKHGHLTVAHDLHNHDGELPDGIAESFVAWAKRENLSFWQSDDLTDWVPLAALTFEKGYADVQCESRIDADYFQPKYERIEAAIKRYPHGYTRIRDEFEHNKSTFKIEPEKVYRYVEIGSVNTVTGDITAEELLGKDLPANAKRVLKKGDIIVSKVRTYRGAITIVQEDGYVGSGAFCVLREKGRVNKETLLSCLCTDVFLTWSLKPSTGTSYPTLDDDDILDFPIPLLSPAEQARIKQSVTASFDLLRESKALRLHGKQAVEIAMVLED